MPFDGQASTFRSKTVVFLEMLEFSFEGGKRWLRGRITNPDGQFCLMGGIYFVRKQIGQSDDNAVHYLASAIRGRYGFLGASCPLGFKDETLISGFNDIRSHTFYNIRAIIHPARELAMVDAYVEEMERGSLVSVGQHKRRQVGRRRVRNAAESTAAGRQDHSKSNVYAVTAGSRLAPTTLAEH